MNSIIERRQASTIGAAQAFICRYGYPPKTNITISEVFCTWCQSEPGQIHSLACPEGERYKYFQLLGQSGIPISAVTDKFPVLFYIDPVHSAASTLGRLGGQAKSPAKSTSSRENGRKGGRPKKAVAEEIVNESNLDLFK